MCPDHTFHDGLCQCLVHFCTYDGLKHYRAGCGMTQNDPPSAEDLGFVKSIRVEEMGGTVVTVLEQDQAVRL